MADTLHKNCFICKQSLPREAFHKSSARPDGLYPYCRPCDSKRRADRKNADPERNAREVARKAAYDVQYFSQNKERIAKRLARYYLDNADRKKALIKAWQQENVERVRAYKASNKAKRRAACNGGIGGPELLEWKRRQTKVCYWCGSKCARKHHVDHYVPLTKGGRHELANLVISCPTCNQRKCAKDPLDFAREVGRLL